MWNQHWAHGAMLASDVLSALEQAYALTVPQNLTLAAKIEATFIVNLPSRQEPTPELRDKAKAVLRHRLATSLTETPEMMASSLQRTEAR